MVEMATPPKETPTKDMDTLSTSKAMADKVKDESSPLRMGSSAMATPLKTRTFSRKPQYAAEKRFHAPHSHYEAPEVDLLKANGTFVHAAQPLKVPVPQIVHHSGDKVYGTNDADCHSANTNPGFSRNPLGGFYTQIR